MPELNDSDVCEWCVHARAYVIAWYGTDEHFEVQCSFKGGEHCYEHYANGELPEGKVVNLELRLAAKTDNVEG